MSKLTQKRVLLSSALVALAKREFVIFKNFVSLSVLSGAKRLGVALVLVVSLTSVYSITRVGAPVAQAAAPTTLNFQARLMSSSGNLVPDGTYNIEFKLYNVDSGGSALWTETRTGTEKIEVKNGYLSAYLGDVTALPTNVWNQQLWLTMNIGGTGAASWDGEMNPRIRLTSVPFAFRSTVSDSAETLSKNTGTHTGTVEFANMTADRKFLFPDTSLATTASPGTICVFNGANSNCPAASGSAYYLHNDTALQTQTNFHIQARDSGVNGTIGGVIAGAANGQTVDLLQFRASDDTDVLAAVTAVGNFQVASSLDVRTAGTLSVGTTTATALSLSKAGASTTVNGALTVSEAGTFNSTLGVTGMATLSGGLIVPSSGNVAFQRNTTDITTTGTLNDLDLGTGVMFRLNGASTQTVTSITGGTDGRIITIINAAAQQALFNNDSCSGCTASNRIVTGTNGALALPPGGSILLGYDSSASRWRIIGGTAVSGGGANRQLNNLQGTIAVNASLTTGTDNTIDLGSNSFSWRTLYADTSVLTPTVDTDSATALNIGTTNATNITMGHNAGTFAVDGTNFDLATNGVMTLAGGQTADITTQANQNLTVEANGTGTIVLNDTVTVAGTQTFSGVTIDITTGTNEDLTIDANGTGLLQLNDSVVVAAQQTIRFVGGTTAQRPASPSEGMMYFDTDTDKLLIYSNGKWQGDRLDVTKTVAPSNAAQQIKDSADYVATGTSDQTTINAALTAAAGGRVYLFEGTFITDDAISVPNNTVLAGSGAGTLIQFANIAGQNKHMIANTDTTTGTGVTVRDLKLDGNDGINTTGSFTGIFFNGLGGYGTERRGALIQGVTTQNFLTQGIRLENSVQSIVTGSTANNNGGSGMFLQSSSHNTVTGNTASGNGVNGIGLNASSNNTITANTTSNNTQSGLSVASSSNHNAIDGNTSYANGGIGISLTTSSSHNTVSTNTSNSNGSNGMSLNAAHNNSLVGNTSSNNTLNGIGLTSANQNTLTGDTTSGNGTNGISLSGSSRNTVTGSSISSNLAGGTQLVSTSDDNVISSGVLYDNGGSGAVSSITVTSSSNNQIIGNRITDTAGTAYAINISNAGANTNYLADNTFSGTGATTINDAGTGTIFAGQIKNSSNGNYFIQPAGTIELMKNTNVTGTLSASVAIQAPAFDTATAGTLTIGSATATAITLGRSGVTTTNAGALTVSQLLTANAGISASGGTLSLTGNAASSLTTSSGALTITSAAAANWSTAAGNLTVDSAAALNLGTGNANTVSISRTGVTTTINGALTVTEAGTFNGGLTAASNFTVTGTGNVAFQRNTTNYTATGTQNNVNLGTGSLFRITSASALTITGIAGGADGRIITLLNASSQGVTFNNNDTANSSAANVIITGTGGSVSVPAGGTAQLAYDSSSSVWRVIAITASAGAANQQLSNLSNTNINTALNATATNLTLQTTTSGNIVFDSAGTIELQDNANVTGTLNVSGNFDSNGSLTVGNANQFVISNTGVVTSGTWNGTVLTDAYVADAITVSSSGSVDWTALNNYPAACAAGSALTQLGDTITCSSFATGTAASYIQNGTGVQASANFYIRSAATGSVAAVLEGANGQTADLLQFNTYNGTTSTTVASFTAAGNLNVASTIDRQTSGALTIGGSNTTTLNLSTSGSTKLSVTNTGTLQFAQGANRTFTVATTVTNAAGYNLTVSAGTAGSGASAFTGGTLNLQGGAAGGTGNANGGSVSISGGAGVGTGVQGLINMATTAFNTSTTQAFSANGSLSVSLIDTYSTIPVSASTTGVVVTVPAPTITTIGRVLYISNVGNTNDFNISLGGTSISINLKPNSTATLIWNGNGWTAAGASSSTDLQSAYNNTSTSAGGAEIVLNPIGGAADGFTIRNNATTPINGGLLEVQSAVGTNLFSVNNRGTELAANGGSETSSTFATNWTAAPAGGTVTRTTTSSQYVTGQAAVQVATSGANHGVRNNLISNPAVSTTFTVSFTAKASVAISGSNLNVQYSRDGGTSLVPCASYSTQNLSTTSWTKISCTITTDGTTATNPDLIIRQADATARNIWIDNLSFIQNDSTTEPSNVQIGGGINGGPITLFTLDRATSPPVANGNDTYLGSMYYDTTTGRIQCYEADGWGACGSAPDNIITLTPEYTGAVLNGNGIGVMTADICANQASVLVVGTLCASGEARNFYRWTSPQATLQDYSIYVTYKLPSTFKQFADNDTMKLTAYRDDPDNTDALVKIATYKKSSSGGLTLCGSETNITQSSNSWEQRSVTGSENSCGFAGDDYVIFKITMSSRNNTNVYVENLDFTFSNK